MNVDALIDEARRTTALDDLGEGSWRDGVDVLVASLNGDARLNPLGQAVLRGQILTCLRNRLRVVAWHQAVPQAGERAVEDPLFIIGLPRTGTTLLSNLLNQDPANRSLIRWEARHPVPPPEPGTTEEDPRLARQRILDDRFHAVAPRLPSIHHEEPDGPTECLIILAQDFRSAYWEVMANVSRYGQWALTADHSSSYRWHRRVLQVLQWKFPGRWVLKSPYHCGHLEALVAVYPEARFVVTHRDPVTAATSMCSLVSNLSGVYSDADHRAYIVQHWPAKLAEGMRRLARFRDDHGDARFFDLTYVDLVADPVGQMRRLYAHLGRELPPEVELRMAAHVAANPQGRHGPHRYSASDLGLDPISVRKMFEEYSHRYLQEP